MRRVPQFAVARVEVSGISLLSAAEVIAAAGIQRGQNVWSEPKQWEVPLRRHPLIMHADVSRDLFTGLRVHVEEERPVALVAAEVLRPTTAAGELLPVNPARLALDLPIVQGVAISAAHSRLRERRDRQLLTELGRLSNLDPALVARVSEVRASAEGDLLLTLTRPAAHLILPAGADPLLLLQLRAVVTDLERRAASGTAPDSAAPVPLVDFRFGGQAVLRLSPAA